MKRSKHYELRLSTPGQVCESLNLVAAKLCEWPFHDVTRLVSQAVAALRKHLDVDGSHLPTAYEVEQQARARAVPTKEPPVSP